ncbi:MAG: hypothetical protein IAG10_29930 [Planctomycetaceae bacterium]|nr:hypothetical protein [Planctomycetaceae bacterium]
MNTATLQFPGYAAGGILPDGNYRVHVNAAGIEDQFGLPMVNDYDGDFFSLAGDANRDRAVKIGDFAVLATNYNQDEMTWADGDFNLDERVSIADFSILASNYNKTLPPPATLSRAAALLPLALREGAGRRGETFGIATRPDSALTRAAPDLLDAPDSASVTRSFFTPFANGRAIV